MSKTHEIITIKNTVMKKQLLTSLFVGLLATTAFGQALDESFETWIPEGWVVNPSENA